MQKFTYIILFALLANFTKAQNLIPNPGFELGSGNDFTNWSKFNGADLMTETKLAAEVRSGDRALKAEVTGAQANTGQAWSVQLVSAAIPTVIGEEYTFKIWVKKNAGTAVNQIRFSTQPDALYSANYTVTADWTQLSWSFTANVDATMMVLDLGETTGTFFLDDMELTGATAGPPIVNNLLLNGGFEEGQMNDFTNWSKYNGAEFLTETKVENELRSGTRALKAEVTGTQANQGQAWSLQLVSAAIPTVIGEEYTFKAWVKKKAGTANNQIRFSTQPEALYSANYEVTEDWTQLRWTFNANVDATMLVLDLGETIGTYYIDDIELTGAAFTAEDKNNLLMNWSFEQGQNDDFLNWSKYNGADLLTASTDANSGQRALKATVTGTQPNAGQAYSLQLASDEVNTVVGSTYELSVYAKYSGNNTPEIRFSTAPSPLYSPNFSVDSSYTKITWSFIANEPKTRVLLDLGQFNNTYWLDDVKLLLKCGVNNYTPPLTQKPIAEGKNKFLGSVYANTEDTLFARYFNQVTAENGGKWGSVETSDGVFNFANSDAARLFAKKNNFPFRYHVLLWGSQQPAWLKPLSDADKVRNIKEWISEVANHYDGSTDSRARLDYVEVLNETLNDPPTNTGNNTTDNGSGDYLNALRSLNTELKTAPWEYDWIVNAFKLAREAFPCETKLMINEYGVENNTNLMNRYAVIVDSLMKYNLIDVVGFQAHSFSTRSYGSDAAIANVEALRANLDILASRNLPLMVTEFDVDGDRPATGSDADKNKFQKEEYERIFGLFWNHPSVIGITLWGYRPGMWRTEQRANLIDACVGGEKPALAEYLNNSNGTNPQSIRASANPPLKTDFRVVQCGIVEEPPKPLAQDNPSIDQLLIYPNPSLGKIQYRTNVKLMKGTMVALYDQFGRMLKSEKLANDAQENEELGFELNQNTGAGTYFLKIHQNDKPIIGKIMVY